MNERIKDLEIMKALRYLLILVAMMGVLSVSANAPTYGKSYNPGKQASYQGVQMQMPSATMTSTGSAIMYTGSSLPSAATEGVTTTYGPAKVGPRRVGENDGFDETETPDEQNEPFPIGDTMWPLMVCACAYLIIRVWRKRTRV